MSWNLPPGVTGNEYEIAGPDREYVSVRKCNAEGVSLTTIDPYEVKKIRDALDTDMSDGRLRIAFNEFLRRIETTEIIECPFEGSVDVTGYAYSEWWTCPVCRTQHDVEVDEE